MRVWPHASQPSTWPPSTAVRQASIADITLSWSRPTWPACAARQAGPWRRKMSATSSAGRMAGSGARIVAFHQQPEMLERARHRPDRLGGDAGIEGGGVELGVAEQDLDDPDVDVLLQQVRGEAVAQGVRGDPLPDAGGLRGLVDGAVELPGRDRLQGVAAREQPAVGQHDA